MKEGNFSSEVKDALKRIYIQEKNTEVGFDEYIAILTKETYLKMLEDVRKSMISEESPSFVLNDMNGKPVSNTDLRGKVVIIDFWATWCEPCRVEMPALQATYDAYQDQGLRILAINLGETRETASAWANTMRLTFDILLDPQQETAMLYQLRGQPSTYVIAPSGIITQIYYGATSEAALKAALAPYFRN